MLLLRSSFFSSDDNRIMVSVSRSSRSSFSAVRRLMSAMSKLFFANADFNEFCVSESLMLEVDNLW